MNEQHNEREAAIERLDDKWARDDDISLMDVLGEAFDAGAASVDRVEIVEKFEKVKESIITHIQVHDSCHDHACPTHQKLESALAEMDAVIAAMEKSK